VIEVGLTGGIGSGKSSVAERLVARGAGLVDADAIVRDVQRPGGPVLAAMVQRWGDSILDSESRLDRQAVADVVFNDSEELEALSAIVNPAVVDEMARQRAAFKEETTTAGRDSGGLQAILILDIPLLVESGHGDMAGVIVVDIAPDLAVQRLVEYRGFSEADARARMANQASREERLASADFVVDNSGDIAQLDREVARCWDWLASLS
jgi:dephospho-CoA kinase